MQDSIKKALKDGRWTASTATAFSDWATDQALKTAPKEKRTRDRVSNAVWRRLAALTPHKKGVAKMLTSLSFPPSTLGPRLVWRIADRIWEASGDTSTDYNRYTKRLLLSGVISATTLYWLNDTSKGHVKTRAFLDARIENVLKVGQIVGRFKRSRA